MKNTKSICKRGDKNENMPRCKGILGERPALSRRDGKTDICSKCGLLEAFEDVEKLMKTRKENKNANKDI